MRERALYLVVASISFALVFAQSSSSNSSSSQAGSNSSTSHSSNDSSSLSDNFNIEIKTSFEINDDKSAILEFLNPTGIRITIPEPHPESSKTVVKFHININRELDGVRRVKYEKEVQIPSGGNWSYTFQDIRWQPGDTVYYTVEVEGNRQSQVPWSILYRGTRHVPYSNTNGSSSLDMSDCRPSLTVFNGGQTTCFGEVVVNTFRFDSVEYLSNYLVGDKPEESFTAFSHDNVIWEKNGFKITPSLLEDEIGLNAVNKNLTLSKCTAEGHDLCTSVGRGYLINPPILSGRQTTKNTLTFCYGVLSVTAKLPKGDWIVPELWLVPKNKGNSNSPGRIVLAKSRGNAELTDGDNDYSNRVLEAGIEYGNGKETMVKKVQNTPWSDSVHIFKLVWTKDLLEFYVDDEEIGHVHLDATSNSKLQPFNEECYLVFGVHVGGDKDFPDNLVGKPWENNEPSNKLKFWQNRPIWQKTWTGDHYLKISGLGLSPVKT